MLFRSLTGTVVEVSEAAGVPVASLVVANAVVENELMASANTPVVMILLIFMVSLPCVHRGVSRLPKVYAINL